MNRPQRLDPGAPGDLTKETLPMNRAEEVLRVDGVEKRYRVGDRSLDVLRGVSLAANRGEYLALRGSSGAGKSTLLHLCGGLDTVDAGTIIVAGETLTSMNGGALAQFRNRRIGFVFQAYQLLPELTAWENVALPARIARIAAPIAAKKARALLDRVGLAGRLEHRPNQLSGENNSESPLPARWSTTPRFSSRMNPPETSIHGPEVKSCDSCWSCGPNTAQRSSSPRMTRELQIRPAGQSNWWTAV